MVVTRVRIKFISLRVFSRITFGSSERQRSRFGANTIARFDESILVEATTSGCEKSWRKWTRHVSTYDERENLALLDWMNCFSQTHQSINCWNSINYCHHIFGIVTLNTFFVKFIRYQWVIQLAEPQLQNTSRRMSVCRERGRKSVECP